MTIRPTTPLALRILQQHERRREISFAREAPANVVDKVSLSMSKRMDGGAEAKESPAEPRTETRPKPLPQSYSYRSGRR
ncbi:MAG: hypothetical protein D6682_04885 [Zetaproteobacteria bacterium]|nr:MAG: hypothetical protein D6682_04885 [Zetaproteobacteria bacterium]